MKELIRIQNTVIVLQYLSQGEKISSSNKVIEDEKITIFLVKNAKLQSQMVTLLFSSR